MKCLDEIFDIWYGVNLEVVNCDIEENGLPFVSRQSVNNGVVCFVKPIDGIFPNPAKTLSIAASGSVLTTFYHDYEYYSGRDVYIAKPKEPMTKEELLYYCYAIEFNKYRYNYGRAANRTLQKIIVPTYQETSQIRKKSSNFQFDKTPLSSNKLELKTDSWKWFRYDELFEISGTKTTPKLELEESGIGFAPYVTTQAVNNGVEGFYALFTEKGNVLTVDSAVLGFCAYQEKDFSASDHVEKMNPKFKMNKYIALFLTTIINKEQYRYSYGRKCSQTKLKRSLVKLPATLNAQGDYEPDWQWMEDYIKSLPYSACL